MTLFRRTLAHGNSIGAVASPHLFRSLAFAKGRQKRGANHGPLTVMTSSRIDLCTGFRRSDSSDGATPVALMTLSAAGVARSDERARVFSALCGRPCEWAAARLRV